MTHTTNGSAGAGPMLRMPIRRVRLELADDYAGFWVEMRANPPLRVFLDIQAGSDFGVLQSTIGSLILDWNLVDDDGNALPIGQIDALSMEVFRLVLNGYMQSVVEVASVPKGSSETSSSG